MLLSRLWLPISEMGPFTVLELTALVKLDGQKAPRICGSLPPQQWHHKCIHHCTHASFSTQILATQHRLLCLCDMCFIHWDSSPAQGQFLKHACVAYQSSHELLCTITVKKAIIGSLFLPIVSIRLASVTPGCPSFYLCILLTLFLKGFLLTEAKPCRSLFGFIFLCAIQAAQS